MFSRGTKGVTAYARFFYNELTTISPSLEILLNEAYILVKHCRFSYSDVKEMTKFERISFMEFLRKEKEVERDELERH